MAQSARFFHFFAKCDPYHTDFQHNLVYHLWIGIENSPSTLINIEKSEQNESFQHLYPLILVL